MKSTAAERDRSSTMAEVRLMTLLVCLFVLFSFSTPVLSAPADGLQVLKISPQDNTAVVRGKDGTPRLVREGEVVSSEKPSAVSDQRSAISKSGDQQSAISSQRKKEKSEHTLTITEIAEGRVVLEERSGNDVETVIIRLINGKQKVDRIRKTAPVKQQQLTAVSRGSDQRSVEAAISGQQSEQQR